MKTSLRYAMTGAAGIVLVTAGLWPFLDEPARDGVLLAGAIALSVQVVAFALLIRFRNRWNTFLAVWVGGTLFRMGLVLVLATVMLRAEVAGAVPLLLSLAGFLFGLLLLEPAYFRREVGRRVDVS